MAYPYTENGYNMFDMLSLLQKGIRRSSYNDVSLYDVEPSFCYVV